MRGTLRRVAFISMHTSPTAQAGTGDAGGLNVSLLSTATELAARGIEVDLLTRAVAGPRVSEVGPGIMLRELPAGGSGSLPKENLMAVCDEFGEAVAVATDRLTPRYDIIHAHYWLSGLATLPVALELHIPFVQSFHTLGAMKNRHLAHGQDAEPEARLRSEAYLAGQASAIIAGSAAEVDSLIDDLHAPAERIWVIPPGVDVDTFRPDRSAANDRVRRLYGIEPGRPILALAGRIQPLKNQQLGVRVLAELRMREPELRPVLVIAGEATPGDAAYLEGLQHLALSLGVADDVRFPGALSRDRLADLLAAASLTLVPSTSETFGLVALESAAAGTPVIGFRGTGLVESVAEGRSGLLMDTHQPAEWAQAAATLLQDADLLARLSRGAREHALGFTWASTAAALRGVYSSLLA